MTEREDYRMEFKITTAGVLGLIGSTVIVVLMWVGFSVYRDLAMLFGFWTEPDLAGALMAWLVTCLVWLLLWLAIRAWLIYKWVVR
jgi:hypothetical protein